MPRSSFKKAKRVVFFLALASLIFTFAPLLAQEQAPTIPPGPLIKTLPANAQWLIEFKYSDENPKSNNPPQLNPETGQTRVKKIVNIRTGSVSYQEITDESGKKTGKWFANNEQYSCSAGSSDFHSAGSKDFNNVSYEYHSPSGLQGFEWISKNKFVEIRKIFERECLIFADQQEELALRDPELFAIISEQRANPIIKTDGKPAPISKVGITACIDLETRLPVVLQIGKETQIFTFLDAPTTPVTLPPELVRLLEQRQTSMAPLMRAASRP